MLSGATQISLSHPCPGDMGWEVGKKVRSIGFRAGYGTDAAFLQPRSKDSLLKIFTKISVRLPPEVDDKNGVGFDLFLLFDKFLSKFRNNTFCFPLVMFCFRRTNRFFLPVNTHQRRSSVSDGLRNSPIR